MELNIYSDEYFMKEALKEALKAMDKDEVPVGAVIVSNNKIIARSHNSTELLNDVTAHAEILCITTASQHLSNKYLDDCKIYITLEPCLMCAGALFWSQIGQIIYGAGDEKRGYSMSTKRNVLHPRSKVISGVLADECSALLKEFFKSKR